MRSKEDAHDYRYFPDPDLVPVIISDEWLQAVKDRQPELRTEKFARYKKEFDIPDYDAEIPDRFQASGRSVRGDNRAVRQAEKGIELADG